MQNQTHFGNIQRELRKRWRVEWTSDPILRPVDLGLREMVQAVEGLISQKAALSAEGSLTAKGAREKIREVAKVRAVPALRRAAKALEAGHEAIRQKRASLALPTPDNGNMAEAILRSETRAWLRGMRETQTAGFLLSDKADDRIVQAVLEAPAIMSGISEKVREDMQQRAIERRFGKQLAELDEMEDAITLASSAVSIGLHQLKTQTDLMDEASFNSWMEEVSRSMDAQEPEPPVLKDWDTLSKEMDEEIDEIFARGFPELYPNHPVNRG